MRFLNKEHERRFRELMFDDRTNPQYKERQALFCIMAGNDDLYSKRYYIYDFVENWINPECLNNDKIDFYTSSKALIRLGLNHYNGCIDEYISPRDILYCLDEYNYNLSIFGIDVHFGMDIENCNIEEDAMCNDYDLSL